MKKNIKIHFVLLLIIIVGVIVYFALDTNKTNKELSEKMKQASSEYFENYISATDSINTYTITLEELKTKGEYNLKGLEKCNDKLTKAHITINFKTGKPKKIETELKC